MEFEQIKEKLENYVTENDLKYLRKSHIADFCIKNSFELEDVTGCIEYSNGITSFYERIGDTRYKRYILGNKTGRQIENATGLTKCNSCGDFTATPITTEDNKHFCCESCGRVENYYKCNNCNKYVKTEYNYNNEHVCKDCLQLENVRKKYNIVQCKTCNSYVNANRMFKLGDNYCCHNCVNNNYIIDGYHCHDRRGLWRPKKNNREKSNYFGWENEFEIKGDTPRNAIALSIDYLLKENGIGKFFIYENDGSLNNGIEAISMPLTLPWLYANESKLQPIYDFLLSNNCTAEKTTTTGLHIHFIQD